MSGGDWTTVQCNAGQKVLGGGCNAAGSPYKMQYSGPDGDDRWKCGGHGGNKEVWAVCATKDAQAGCQWSAPISGAVDGNNVGSKHDDKTLSECKVLCDGEPLCKSIDYSSTKKRCYLGSCTLGDKGCSNNNDNNYVYYACGQQEAR